MQTVLLACRTIEDEIQQVLAKKHPDLKDIIWIESGLHNSPVILHAAIQKELDQIVDIDRVLLGFGFCGNAVMNLKTQEYTLIIPRAEDCITLLLGSEEIRNAPPAKETYFLTPGWLRGEVNIYDEYLYSLKKYGKELTEEIYSQLLAHFKYLGTIDTGTSDFTNFLRTTQHIADELGLQQRSIQGTLSYLEKLLTGPWSDDEFISLSAHSSLSMEIMHPELK